MEEKNTVSEKKDIYCHCTECPNPIEIISLDNNIIKFKCANEKEQHEKEIPLKDFNENMKVNQKYDIYDSCQIHSKEYKYFCADCNKNLCEICFRK